MTNPPHVVTASTRRAWSAAEKRAIVAETELPGATVSEVARRHHLHSSLLFRWRRHGLAGRDDAAAPVKAAAQPTFVPLALAGPVDPPSSASEGVIEIDLAGGHRLRARGRVDAAVLGSVVAALVER